MSKLKPDDSDKARGKEGKNAKKEKSPEEKARGTRETVESIIIAVILAFLFRAFEAEAFVIPTGSMAPTLQGRHFDVACEKCGHRYRTGASDETSVLVGTTCPLCRYTQSLDYFGDPNERPFHGDRILVNKFAYQFSEPERWDVIVFKYPGNAKQNYIKRLVGLPNERVRIQYGNIYAKHAGDEGYHIARKPPEKVVAMLQLVDDTNHVPPELVAAGWPSRWQPWAKGSDKGAWQTSENGKEFSSDGSGSKDAWLRYRQLTPTARDWAVIEKQQLPPDLKDRQGELITDFYAYNCHENSVPNDVVVRAGPGAFADKVIGPRGRLTGWNWVGDLSVECLANVAGDSGEILLDLVEGGVHYGCRINVADGQATLSIDGGFEGFQDERAKAAKLPTAATSVKGKGSYRLRLANVDDQVFLWVNGWPVKFDEPTTYGPPVFVTPENVKPAYSAQDPGDMAPAGVGTKGAAVTLSNLRIYRDVYYIAANQNMFGDDNYKDAYFSGDETERIFTDPSLWNQTSLFDTRRHVEFPDNQDPSSYFGPDQFFPCGDNSPASKDGRLWAELRGMPPQWDPPPYVDRNLLIGKALLIYWPHTWNRPVPFMPNPQRMGLIR